MWWCPYLLIGIALLSLGGIFKLAPLRRVPR